MPEKMRPGTGANVQDYVGLNTSVQEVPSQTRDISSDNNDAQSMLSSAANKPHASGYRLRKVTRLVQRNRINI